MVALSIAVDEDIALDFVRHWRYSTPMAQEVLHPFRRFLDEHDKTQRWAVERAEALGEKLSQGYLSDLLSGGAPNPTMETLLLLERIASGMVSASKMASWHVARLRERDPDDDTAPAGGDSEPVKAAV